MARGLREGWPEAFIKTCPLADGGEGTMEVLVEATGGEKIPCEVTGPLGERREAEFGVLGEGDTAVVEMASASGLELIPGRSRDPMLTTTRGTGDLIRCALDRGIRNIFVAIGGSGTNDGGTGMAAALGARFTDRSGAELPPGGGHLAQLEHVDLSGMDPRIGDSRIIVASDVANPLLGERGATRVYALQKGAGENEVDTLEMGLERLVEVVRGDLGADGENQPGAGAAGGLGYGLMFFLGAEVRPGVEVVMQSVGFHQLLDGCGLVITGEGRLDSQTSYGKTVMGVARSAREKGVPVLALGGEVTSEAECLHESGVSSLIAIPFGPMTVEESMAGAAPQLRRTCREIGSLIRSVLSADPSSSG